MRVSAILSPPAECARPRGRPNFPANLHCNVLQKNADRKQVVNMTSISSLPPPPDTVSTAACEALRNLPSASGPEDLEIHRGMCAAVQRELGAVQLAHHGVRMEERAIGLVPV